MGIRYLGSKARVLDDLALQIGEPYQGAGQFVDAFSGTGVVASLAADLGWDVHVNDHLLCARLLSSARLLAACDVPFASLSGYIEAVETLNATKFIQGFLWREYSPASVGRAPRTRRYFTEENAARLDGMRSQVRRWRDKGIINNVEESLLLADLLEAASAVANTAGTFGSFLSEWSPTALRSVWIKARALREEPVRFTAGQMDVFSVQTNDSDTVYLDPPYTKRQYAAYYHLLETLAYGDEPEVAGITGLRPWEAKASPFSYKRYALSAMLKLVGQLHGSRVLISYSSDGHIDLQELEAALGTLGTVAIHEIRSVPRYQPMGVNMVEVREYVVEFRRT